ncbi:MAG: dethiobiotin synthase [Sphaerospermopsis sp. SIO1G2]|nr:dethiobiotin synthase [Sphaerospermopsis sp. SIO1G2]
MSGSKPFASHYFVTAIGTDIGKSWGSALMARYKRAKGIEVALAKPVMSGYDAAQAASCDAGVLLRAMGTPLTPASIDAIAPWRYSAPLSPHRAAELEGQSLSPAALEQWCLAWLQQRDTSCFTLIEGIGGVMVPLTYHYTVLDWMKALRLPVILVVSDYLGAISHSLTALHMLHQAGMTLRAVIVNQASHAVESANSLYTLQHLSPYCDEVLWAPLPRLDNPDMALTDIENRTDCKSFFNLVEAL